MMSNFDEIDLSSPSDHAKQRVNTDTAINGATVTSKSTVQNNTLISGESSFLFSISKRPRRNVKKQSIMDIPSPHANQEDKVSQSGLKTGAHVPSCAPKIALGFFLMICSIGGYRGLTDYTRPSTSDLRIAYLDVLTSMKGNERYNTILQKNLSSSNSGKDLESVFDTADIAETPILLYNKMVVLPTTLDNLVNVFHEEYDPLKHKLYLWHIPRTGSTTVKRIASICMRLTLASEAGKSEVERGVFENVLKIVEGPSGMQFANVDMSNPDGIAVASSLKAGSDSRIDLISSAYLYSIAGIFEPEHKGYMFAMFRHPIDRAVSLYHNMRMHPQYAGLIGHLDSVELYSRSTLVENNWMTRFLSNTLSGELSPEHEAIAKEVLRTKCIVGLLKYKAESMRRLELLLQMKAEKSQRAEECKEKLLYWNWPGKNRHDPLDEGGETWENLYKHNTFDLRLYDYAEKLFVAQARLFK